MKKNLLGLCICTSMSFAEINSCNFDFIDEFTKISQNVKKVTDIIWLKNFHSNLDNVIIYNNWREKNKNKDNFKFSNWDYYSYNKEEKDLCIIKKIDYNYKRFEENWYLEYLKNLSEDYGINYNSMLAIFKEETGFNDSYSGGFWRMTNIAITEVNSFFKLDSRSSSEIRKWLADDQKSAIKYSLLYFYIMIQRYKGNEYLAVRKYNWNSNIASNWDKICDNYLDRYIKNLEKGMDN